MVPADKMLDIISWYSQHIDPTCPSAVPGLLPGSDRLLGYIRDISNARSLSKVTM